MIEPALHALAVRFGEALLAAEWRACTAESCTGGLIAATITEIAGSSGWFERGFVTYSNEAKCESIGVLPATLAAHGAVSEAVAREMALGALRASRAHLALSVTGVAGPAGGSPAKPVGTVCFGWATAQRVEVGTCLFPGDRAAIRVASVEYSLRRALAMLPGRDAGSSGVFA